ncbi:MAG: phage major capsid protein, partial [Devosia sp.]
MNRLEFKAALTVTEAGEITGIAWPFGSADSVGDMITKGAFEFPETLPMLFGHDQNDVIGVWEVIEETAEGLIVKGRLFLDQIARAREVWTMLTEKAVKGLSIGFETLAATPRRGGGRDIKRLNLAEISIVAVPAHPGAQIHTIKELQLPLEDEENTLTLDGVAERVGTLESDVAAIKDSLGNVEKAATRIETKLARPGTIETKAATSTEIERKALGSFIRTGSEIELKAAATDNGPDGGWFVLPTVDTSIRSLLADLSPMRGLAEVVTIGGSTYERFYSLGKRGATRVVERDDRPQDTNRPELIKVAYGVGEYYAAPAATRHQIEDATVDIAGWLIENTSHDFAETEGEDFLSYDGSNNFARGLLTYGTTNE